MAFASKRRTTMRFKRALLRVLPDSERIRYLAHLPRLETWRRRHAGGCRIFAHRTDLWRHVNDEELGDGPIELLEFGVYRGASVAGWAAINTAPESRFVGFDTFRGLPTPWTHFTETSARGLYDAGGRAPRIEDPRVSFVPGLFQHTLPGYLRERRETGARLVLHLDADLYASTLYVLARCDGIAGAGTVVLFDEFSAVLHEFRALDDYCASHLRDYDVLAATRSPTTHYDQLAIRLREGGGGHSDFSRTCSSST